MQRLKFPQSRLFLTKNNLLQLLITYCLILLHFQKYWNHSFENPEEHPQYLSSHAILTLKIAVFVELPCLKQFQMSGIFIWFD